MNLYKVTAKKSGQELVEKKWVGSQAEAASVRKQFVDEGYKRVELETETVEIPTNKEGLLSWLNANAV